VFLFLQTFILKEGNENVLCVLLKKLILDTKTSHTQRHRFILAPTGGLTPEQAYRNVTINTNLFSARIKNTNMERRNINQKEICNTCKWNQEK